MRVYTQVTVDMGSGEVLHSESHDYTGPVALANGGSDNGSKSNPSYVLPELLPDIAAGARSYILAPPGDNPFIQRATQQIRGGYGARGLANSGIAIQGEQNAIQQMNYQDSQAKAGNISNLLAAGTGQTSQTKQSSGISVVCTELNRQGYLDDATLAADCEYAQQLPSGAINGYHMWAVPLAKLMNSSRLVTWLARPIAMRWAMAMRHRVRGDCADTVVGWLLLKLGVPLCVWLSKVSTAWRPS